jgi:hypothetical protein
MLEFRGVGAEVQRDGGWWSSRSLPFATAEAPHGGTAAGENTHDRGSQPKLSFGNCRGVWMTKGEVPASRSEAYATAEAHTDMAHVN